MRCWRGIGGARCGIGERGLTVRYVFVSHFMVGSHSAFGCQPGAIGALEFWIFCGFDLLGRCTSENAIAGMRRGYWWATGRGRRWDRGVGRLRFWFRVQGSQWIRICGDSRAG